MRGKGVSRLTDIFDHFEIVVVFPFGGKVVAGFVEAGRRVLAGAPNRTRT